MTSQQAVRLCHLYPAEMSIYADRGNIAVLARRLAWRDMSLEVTESHIGEPVDPSAHDLFYMGGGQDRDQDIVAGDLVQLKADSLRSALGDGAAGLFVCGGIQLAGRGYETAKGRWLDGIGVLDLETRAGDSRLIGDLVIDATLDDRTLRIVGYENHVGRTELGPQAAPLGRVVHGYGNNGADGLEGAVQGRVVGTYLHGPLLPKNPDVADVILGWALQYRYGNEFDLEPLDDSLERHAHSAAVARAGVSR